MKVWGLRLSSNCAEIASGVLYVRVFMIGNRVGGQVILPLLLNRTPVRLLEYRAPSFGIKAGLGLTASE